MQVHMKSTNWEFYSCDRLALLPAFTDHIVFMHRGAFWCGYN